MPRRISILLLLSALGLAQEPTDPAERAERLQAEKKYRQAAALYDEALSKTPADPSILQRSAVCLARLRRFADAEKRLSFANQIKPDDTGILFDLASCLQNQSRYGEALVHWRRVESLGGSDPRVAKLPQVPYNRGHCASKIELIPEAIEAMTQAVQMAPELDDYREQLAGLYLNENRFPEAIRDFRVLVQRQPTTSRHHYHLGHALLQSGDDEGAERHLKEARRLDPRMLEVSLKLGRLYQRQKKLDVAYSIYYEAATKNPLASEAWYNLSRIAQQKNMPEEAAEFAAKHKDTEAREKVIDEERRELRRRTDANPRDEAAWLRGAEIALENGAFDHAQEALNRLVAINPVHELAVLNLSALLARRLQFQDAIFELDKILEKNPAHPFVGFESGKLKLQIQDPAAAVDALEPCLAEFPAKDERFGQALDLYGEAARLSKQLPRSIDPLEIGISKLPVGHALRPRLALRFGMACLEAKTPARAIPLLESAVGGLQKSDPMREPGFKMLASLAQANGEAERAREYLDAISKSGGD